MNHYIKLINNNSHYLIFFLFLIFQLNFYDDYGFSWDEGTSRLNGIVSFNYILEKLNILENLKFQNVSGLENYRDNEYGVFFDVVNICVEKLFSINNIKNIYYSKHFVNCLFFFIASVYFYYTLNIFYEKNLCIIGFLIFILHPRILSQSFYNGKDIIFLVFFCISNFYLIKYFVTRSIKYLFILSIFISISIGTRVMGLIIPLLFLFFFILENSEKNKLKNFFLIIPFLTLIIFFTILFWPYLWENPTNILAAFSSMKNYSWNGVVFFESTYYSGKYLPWYYLPKTILITTPIFYIVLFFIGSFYIFKTLFKNLLTLKNERNIWHNNEDLFCFYSLLVVYLTIGIIVELKSTLYGGWRQVYFIYPSIIFLCIYGLNKLLTYKKFKRITLFFTYFFLFIILFWNYQNHPYQYVYYNNLITNKNIKNYELDYWGVSNLDILKKILEISKNKENKIFIQSFSPYQFSLNLIDKKFHEKFVFVDNIDDAQFIITNHYYQNKHPLAVKKYLENNFKLVYEIRTNNVSINSIYKIK